jgi:hypothetical protein
LQDVLGAIGRASHMQTILDEVSEKSHIEQLLGR